MRVTGDGRGTIHSAALSAVREDVDRELRAGLEEPRALLRSSHLRAEVLADELLRLIDAGGMRLRPALCVWAYRAAGGEPGVPILRVGAALELFHTFALIHDDVMDGSPTRRGVESTHARFARERAARGVPAEDARAYGVAIAVLAGDLAAALADAMLAESGFPPGRLLPAKRRFDAMRVRTAAGQFLDLSLDARDVDEAAAGRVADLKSGEYSVRAPVEIGASLAPAAQPALDALAVYGEALGRAFQLRDDLRGAASGEHDLLDRRPTALLAAVRREAADPDRRLLDAPPDDLDEGGRARVVELLGGPAVRKRLAGTVDRLTVRASDALEGAGLEPEALARLLGVARDLAAPPAPSADPGP